MKLLVLQEINQIKLDDFNNVIDINVRPALQALQIFVADMKEKIGDALSI